MNMKTSLSRVFRLNSFLLSLLLISTVQVQAGFGGGSNEFPMKAINQKKQLF